MEIEWFWLTCIVGIVALCVNSTLGSYFKHKYGNEDDKENNE